MTKETLKKAWDIVPDVWNEVIKPDSEDYLDWLRTFNGSDKYSKMFLLDDKKMADIFTTSHSVEGLDKHILEAEDITNRTLIEATCCIALERILLES